MGELTAVAFAEREPPLSPIAVSARGAVARALLTKLVSWPADRLDRLSGVFSGDLVVVLGSEEADLPWVDGVRYLGRDPQAPSLLLPTTLEPVLPLALLERALVARARTRGRIAVFVDPPALLPLAAALPLSKKIMGDYLAGAAK